MNEQRIERRKHPRFPTKLEVHGRSEDGVVTQMVTEDLSQGGFFCTSTVDFPEMTCLSVTLSLPLPDGADPELVMTEAVVVRRQELPTAEKQRYMLALFFTRFEADGYELLQQYLANRPNRR